MKQIMQGIISSEKKYQNSQKNKRSYCKHETRKDAIFKKKRRNIRNEKYFRE